MPRLCDLPFFSGLYKRVYEIIALEDRLPHPCKINVLEPDEASPPKGVLGFALIDSKTVWFRDMPPDPVTFAHELIHLARKKRDSSYEEIYGYNLSSFIVYLAEKNIDISVNPLRLFEDVSLRDLAATICEYVKIPCDARGYIIASDKCCDDPKTVIKNFFVFIGVIPIFLEPVIAVNDLLEFRYREEYSDEDIVIIALTEFLSVIDEDFLSNKIIFSLLKKLSSKPPTLEG